MLIYIITNSGCRIDFMPAKHTKKTKRKTFSKCGNTRVKLGSTKNEAAKVEPIIISPRRQDIAEIAGLTTETTIRAIGKLAARNLIKIERGKIILDDLESLREYLAR